MPLFNNKTVTEKKANFSYLSFLEISFRKSLLPGLLLGLVAVILTGTYIIPTMQTKRAVRELEISRYILIPPLRDIEQSTKLPIFSEHGVKPEISRNNIKVIRQRVVTVKNLLNSYESAFKLSRPTGLSSYLSQVQYLKHEQTEARRLNAETQAVLNDYGKLIDYMDAMLSAEVVLAGEYSFISSLNSSEQLLGKSAMLTERKDALQAALQGITGLTPPLEVEELHAELKSLMEQTSEVYSNLIYGASIYSTYFIDSHLRQAETLIDKYDIDYQDKRLRVFDTSPLLSEVNSLGNKFAEYDFTTSSLSTSDGD